MTTLQVAVLSVLVGLSVGSQPASTGGSAGLGVGAIIGPAPPRTDYILSSPPGGSVGEHDDFTGSASPRSNRYPHGGSYPTGFTPPPAGEPAGVVGGTVLPGPDLHPAGDLHSAGDPGSRSCSVCAPGYGVLTLCNGTHDTLCGECPPGTYSDSYTADQPCRPCNSCPKGYYERTPCVNFQDVNCAMCYQNGAGFGNEDFLRKCETITTSTTTLSTAVPSTRVAQRRSTVTAALLPTPTTQQVTSKIWQPVKSTGYTKPAVKTSTESQQPATSPTRQRASPSTTEQRLKPLPPVKGDNGVRDAYVTTETGFLAAGVGEEPKVGAATSVETGGFNWTIFIAAVAAAVVFFVLGVLVSSCVHRPNTKAKPEYALDYGEAPQGDDTVDASPSVTMISNRPLEGAAVAYEDYDNPSAPMYTGNGTHARGSNLSVIEEVSPVHTVAPLESYPAPPLEAPLVPPGAPKMQRRPAPSVGAFSKFIKLLRKPFYNSRDLRYIDEDSDDEIVIHVGRPPSIHYQSPRPLHRVNQRGRSSGFMGFRKTSNRRPRRSRRRYVYDQTGTGNGYGSDNYSTDPGTPSSVRSDLSHDTKSTVSAQYVYVPDVWVKRPQ